jgi:lipoteichoic acid synthase
VRVRERSIPLLDRRDWVYVLSLLFPLVIYELVLKATGLVTEYPASGMWGALCLLRSDMMFALGYALVWIGLFAASRGIVRWLVLVLFHVSASLVVAIETCAYLYFRSTGTTLDYPIVAYYLTKPGEAQGAVSSAVSLGVWLTLAAALLYALLGPMVVTMSLVQPTATMRLVRRAPSTEDGSGRASEAGRRTGRELTRREFLAGGVGTAAGAILLKESLLPSEAAGASASFSRAPVSNLVATELEQSEMEAAAQNVNARHPLAHARLKPTLRTRRRHVALIHLESIRERSVTPYNYDLETMPYLATLAKDSLLVERAYTTIPHTSKAIVSVISGLYPSPKTDIVEAEPSGIPARCLAELLAEQGYKTAWFQSAKQSFEDRPQLVENFGYGHFQAYESMKTEGFQRANYLGYEDDIMLEPSRRWLEENADDPTLVMFLGVTPHHQYLALTRYGRKHFAKKDGFNRYLNSIRYDDFWTKNIIEMYKDLGLYEDTIFIIYGDHGEAFGEHGRYQHDGVIWEEGLRVPLIIHDPQSFDGGARVEGPPAHLLEVPPTIVDMLGYEVVDGAYPGRSMLDLPEDRTLLFGCRPDLLSTARIQGQEKYIYHFGNRPDEFYNLAKDPLERNNLATKIGGKQLEQWRSELLEWHAETTAAYDQPSHS